MSEHTSEAGVEHAETGGAGTSAQPSDGHSRILCLVLAVLAVLAIHTVGRVSAICASANYDSFTYAVTAYQFFSPEASAADLVADKPAGQFLLTGWCYRLWPGPPSRLALVPIESVFLLLGYAAFWYLAWRLDGARTAGVQIVLLVFAFNAYNTLDDSAAGFNVNENYLLLPMLVAATAHLAMSDGRRRGLVRGLGVGLALSIKQTAAGLLVAIFMHGVYRAWSSGRWREAFAAACWTAGGALLAVSPLVIVLAARGWLVPHVHDLANLSGGHLEMPRLKPPPWGRIAPLVPIAWWVLAGVVAWRVGGSASRPVFTDRYPVGGASRGAGLFLWFWLAAEAVILALLNRHSAHYYQPLVVPAALLAGSGVAWVVRTGRLLPDPERARILRWSFMITVALVIPAMMSFVVEAQRRWVGYDLAKEAGEFARRLAGGSS